MEGGCLRKRLLWMIEKVNSESMNRCLLKEIVYLGIVCLVWILNNMFFLDTLYVKSKTCSSTCKDNSAASLIIELMSRVFELTRFSWLSFISYFSEHLSFHVFILYFLFIAFAFVPLMRVIYLWHEVTEDGSMLNFCW